MRFLVLLVAALAAGTTALKRYDGYQLLTLHPATSDQWKLIEEFRQDVELDIWAEGAGYVDVFVGPEKLSSFRLTLAEYQISFELKNGHVQQDIDEEAARLAGGGRAINYDDFNTYPDIMTELDDLVLRCRQILPGTIICTTFSIGTSVEGRDIKGIRIDGPGAQGIWIESNTHAREWLGSATNLKIISHLIDDYPTDPEVQQLVATYDWHLVPIVNPDGYEWTWSNDRLWRKNRSNNVGSLCVGTDLNRNFDAAWMNAGTSTDPCSDTYGGTGPASEPETQAVQNALVSLGPSLLTAFFFHTYAQVWLVPYGSVGPGGACNIAPDHAEMMVVANAGADAIENTYNTVWQRGNCCQVMYPASGSEMDYSKETAGVKYSQTLELRGNSFVIAPSEIEPSFQEVWNGVVAAINAIP